MTNGFFATTATSGFVGKAYIGCPVQNTGYPKGIANAAPYAQAALTKLHTITAAGDGVTATMEIYDGSGYFFGEPLTAGTGGPGQFIFSPTAVSTAGTCRMFSATISGFAITSLNPTSAGWTRYTGKASALQSATTLAIFDNGLVRLVLDKNQTTGATAFQIAFFNGTAWINALKQGGYTTNWRSPTVVSVDYISAKMIEATFTAVDSNSVTLTYRMRISQGTPFIYLNKTAGTTTTVRGLVAVPTGGFKTIFIPVATESSVASKFGSVVDTAKTLNNDFTIGPLASSKFDVIAIYSNDTGTETTVHATDSLVILFNDTQHIFLGFAPRTYALGDGGGADAGNGDGQFREAEDNFTAVTGTWAKATGLTGASSSADLRNTAPAVDDAVKWSMNFPLAGKYYIGACISKTGTTAACDMAIDGSYSGVPNGISSFSAGGLSAFSPFGPFTVTAGNHDVSVKLTSMTSITQIDIDYVVIYLHESSSASLVTAIFPKNLGNSALRTTKPT